MKTQGALLLGSSAVLDALIVAGSFALGWRADPRQHAPDLLVALFVLPIGMWLFRQFGFYESHRLETLRGLTVKVLSAQALAGVLLALLSLIGGPGRLAFVARFLAVSTALLLCQKWIVYAFLHRIRTRGFDTRNVCLIGQADATRRIVGQIASHPHWGLVVVCVGEGPPAERRFRRYPGGDWSTGSLREALATDVIDECVIACAADDLGRERETLAICDEVGVLARVLLEPASPHLADSRIQDFYGQVTMAVGGRPRDERLLLLKRVTDLALASTLLVVLSPLMLLIALLVRLSSPGPVIFRQLRVGLHGRRFRLLKFRTMVDDAELQRPALAHRSITKGPVFKDPTDLRVTDVGRVLRRLSLDELPQLVNVLVGDMSLVGPRPLPVHESNAISGSHRRRFSMRPGLTCLWQVNGRSSVDYVTWMNYDLAYVDEWSLLLDAKLLLKTIPAVISGRGAY